MFELSQTLESGVSLEEAVEVHQGRIPPALRGLVVAGVRSRRLGDLLSRFTEYSSVGAELKRGLWLSLAYPVLTALIALALFMFISAIVVSQLETIYRDFNIQDAPGLPQVLRPPLPGVTIALLLVAHLVSSIWSPILVIVVGTFCAWLAARVFLPRASQRSLAGRLPLLGTVWRTTSLAEFCHLLALLLESELTLPEALRLTGEGVENADIDASCRVMAKQVESGRAFSASMAERSFFPPGLHRLLRWAEQEKSLSEVLHLAGSMFEAQARSTSAFVGTVLTFLCVLIVFSMVLAIPALFAPLFTLISRLSG